MSIIFVYFFDAGQGYSYGRFGLPGPVIISRSMATGLIIGHLVLGMSPDRSIRVHHLKHC